MPLKYCHLDKHFNVHSLNGLQVSLYKVSLYILCILSLTEHEELSLIDSSCI